MSPTPNDFRPAPSFSKSLEEVHGSVAIPQDRHWWRRLLAFGGPAYMISVGYMDPGNWATDLAGGARFGYQLIWVLLLSNLMAVLLQTLSARLGLVAGRDLAQSCREAYPAGVRWILFILCEIAIAACDLAEVLGTAIGLNLLTGIPLLWAVVITAGDVFILLLIQRLGIRKMEGFILMLVATVGACFIVEIFLARPSVTGIAAGFVPGALSGEALYIAIGILGATVMPHNLYLHSALVQSRNVARTRAGLAQACKYNLIDSAIALNAAFFVNAAILILAAAAFHTRQIEVSEIQDAHRLLEGVLGTQLAPIAFAIALICAGQSSTLTGTLAGQITMEGFLHIRLRPWLRRLITRSLAIIPAVLVIAYYGEDGTGRLLILSQVILSLQLSFAVVPLIKFTSSKLRMGDFANPWWLQILAWGAAILIMALNAKLVYEQVQDWALGAGARGWIIQLLGLLIGGGLGLLLLWLITRRDRVAVAPRVNVETIVRGAVPARFARIGVALEATPKDELMLGEALALARQHQAELVLMHVVEGVSGQWYGQQAGDEESREDERYIRELSEKLNTQLAGQGLPPVTYALGYGDVPQEIVRLAREAKVDLMVLGGHGHRRLADLFRGETITTVRHGLKVPVLTVRGNG